MRVLFPAVVALILVIVLTGLVILTLAFALDRDPRAPGLLSRFVEWVTRLIVSGRALRRRRADAAVPWVSFVRLRALPLQGYEVGVQRVSPDGRVLACRVIAEVPEGDLGARLDAEGIAITRALEYNDLKITG